MNKRRILAVARAIEKNGLYNHSLLGFNMGKWKSPAGEMDGNTLIQDVSGHSCKTVGCIAGWAAMKSLGMKEYLKTGEREIYKIAVKYLDLDTPTYGYLSYKLFYAKGARENSLYNIPWQSAVATLRHLAKTGEVDWTVGYQGEEVPSKKKESL